MQAECIFVTQISLLTIPDQFPISYIRYKEERTGSHLFTHSLYILYKMYELDKGKKLFNIKYVEKKIKYFLFYKCSHNLLVLIYRRILHLI